MSEKPEQIEEMIAGLKQLRDELKVKINLGKAEARDEWYKIEEKWQELKARSKAVAEAADESAKDVGSALKVVGE